MININIHDIIQGGTIITSLIVIGTILLLASYIQDQKRLHKSKHKAK